MYDECVCNLTSLRAFPWRSALAIRAHVVRFVKNVENFRKVKTPGNASRGENSQNRGTGRPFVKTSPDSSKAHVFSMFLSLLYTLKSSYSTYMQNDKKLLRGKI